MLTAKTSEGLKTGKELEEQRGLEMGNGDGSVRWALVTQCTWNRARKKQQQTRNLRDVHGICRIINWTAQQRHE
jgi:hypothetical protein